MEGPKGKGGRDEKENSRGLGKILFCAHEKRGKKRCVC